MRRIASAQHVFTTLLAALAVLAAVLTAQPADAAYIGRNGLIALVRANQIYTISPTGAGLKALTTAGKNYRPKFSPDGLRIAYIHEASSTSKDIWVMNADGRGKIQVSRLGAVGGAAWSPDGKQIAFGGGHTPCDPTNGCANLYLIGSTAPYGTPVIPQYYDTDTSAWADESGVQGPPTWSPDGKLITFLTGQDCQGAVYCLTNYDRAAGTNQIIGEMGSGGTGCDNWYRPQYNPSGTTLILTDQPGSCATNKLYPFRTETMYGTTVGTKVHDQDATFSPDGNKIAVMNDASGTANIFVQSPATSTTRLKLTAGYDPDWQSLH